MSSAESPAEPAASDTPEPAASELPLPPASEPPVAGRPSATPPGDPRGEFTLDDLIAHEKKNTRFVLAIFVVAVIFVSGKNFFGGEGRSSFQPRDPVAPITSRR